MARKQKKEQRVFMPCLAFRPYYTVAYSMPADERGRWRKSNRPKVNAPEGVISARAEKRIRLAVQWLIICSDVKTVYSKKENKSFKFLLNFITLTLSEKQKHSDIELKNLLLNPFLDWMKRRHGANCYLWKAESQKDTGNIHFHITTNVFIHWKSIRRKWNELQYKIGYEKCFTDGNTNGKNSTDVKAVKNIKKIGFYLSKYFVKNQDDRRKIEGKLWGSSYNLSNIKVNLTAHDESFEEVAREFFERNETQYLKADYSEIYLHERIDSLKVHPVLRKKFQEIKREIVGDVKQQLRYEVESFF